MIERIEEVRLTAADEAEIARLLAGAFDTDFGGRSYFMQRHHLRLVWRPAAITGHIGFMFRSVRLGDRLVSIAGLGDVATHPAERGKGIASKLLAAATDEARAARAEFVVLFGDAPLYAGHGFRPATNLMRYAPMEDARTGEVCECRDETLMVLPLGQTEWDDDALLDLVGNKF